MKATEFKINNLIQHNGQTLYIVHISSNTKGLGQLSCSFVPTKDTWFNAEDATPLPLTEEWLIKLGFEPREPLKSKSYYNHKINWHYELDGTTHIGCDDGNGEEVPQKIKYVHQLQNLYFALTGEELTIK